MNADERRPERVTKLLLETFPEYPRSDATTSPFQPEHLESPKAPPLVVAFAGEPFNHGIKELSSALSE